jgi:preprotein translocase subunit SecG
METLIIIVTIIDVIVALLLIGVILVQQSKDGGGMAGSAFGGAGEAVFGGQAADQLTKITRVLTAMFFVLTLALAVIIGRRTDKDVSVVDSTPVVKSASAEKSDAVATVKPEVKKKESDGNIKIKEVKVGASKEVDKKISDTKKAAAETKKAVDKVKKEEK